MELIFSVVQVLISVVLIFLVLMHSGKDAGLSGAFGVGSGAGPLGGGSLVERNLNRWTIGFAIAFVAEHDRAPQAALGLTSSRARAHARASQTVWPVMRKPPARSAGQTTPVAKRRP